MARPFLNDIKWPGRRVRPTTIDSPTVASAQDEQEPTPFTIVRRDNHDAIREAFNNARLAVEDIETQALNALKDNLGIPINNRPVTAEAIAILSGTHSSFGVDRPAVPIEDRLDDSSLTYEHYIRAYDTLENADKIIFGFDASTIVSDDYDGTVATVGAITSPAMAAGVYPPPHTGNRLPIDAALEERLIMKRREMFFMIFLAAIYNILRLIADTINSIGNRVKNALSIKILKKRISLGKYVAKPFFWLAKVFYKLADKMEKRAMGLAPKGEEDYISGETRAESFADLSDPEIVAIESEDQEASSFLSDAEAETLSDNVLLPGLDTGRYTGSSGLIFLMGAETIIQATNSYSQEPGREDLRRALYFYDVARKQRQALKDFHQLSHTWGVDSGLDAPVAFKNAAVFKSEPTVSENDLTNNPAFNCD